MRISDWSSDVCSSDLALDYNSWYLIFNVIHETPLVSPSTRRALPHCVLRWCDRLLAYSGRQLHCPLFAVWRLGHARLLPGRHVRHWAGGGGLPSNDGQLFVVARAVFLSPTGAFLYGVATGIGRYCLSRRIAQGIGQLLAYLAGHYRWLIGRASCRERECL